MYIKNGKFHLSFLKYGAGKTLTSKPKYVLLINNKHFTRLFEFPSKFNRKFKNSVRHILYIK